MPTYRVFNSISAHVFGDYEAATAADALDVVARDAGYADHAAACEVVGRDDLTAEIVRRFVVEARTASGWESAAAHMDDAAQFESEARARRAVDDLVRVCGWDRCDLRVRELSQ